MLRVEESMNFLSIAEDSLFKIMEYDKMINVPSSLNLIENNEEEENPPLRKSRLSRSLISNYLLGISLMKSICFNFTPGLRPDYEFNKMLQQLQVIEKKCHSLQQQSLSLTFLVTQHKKEIIDREPFLEDVLRLSFTKEFMSMFQGCVFIPFFHRETPKPFKIPQSELKLEFLKVN